MLQKLSKHHWKTMKPGEISRFNEYKESLTHRPPFLRQTTAGHAGI